MKKLTIIPLILFLILSCTTSKGSLFETVLSASDNSSETAEKEADNTAQASETKNPSIEIKTDPDGAEVYFNNVYKGKSPVFLEEIESGTYSIKIEKTGYYAEERWINYIKNTNFILEIDLKEITGYLNVKTVPADADVTLKNENIGQGVKELQTGRYELEIRAFGYEIWEETIEILENQTTNINTVLQKADFRVTEIKVSRSVFNPKNPGLLGTTKIFFKVSTYGNGDIKIYNNKSEEVWSFHFSQFTDWDQKARWTGQTISGLRLPDGDYTAVITCKAKDSVETIEKDLQITLDSSSVISYKSIWSGNSGLLYTATPDILPQGSFQITSLILGHYDENAGSLFPVQIGFRTSPFKSIEITGQGEVSINNTLFNPYSISLSGKMRLLQPSAARFFNAAITVKGTYCDRTTTDILTNYTGFSAGVPLAVKAGVLGIVIMPEITVSPFKISYEPDYTSEPGFYAWSYVRSGLFLDFGSLTTGLSAAVRTIPFSEGFNIAFPVAAGWELHWIIPETQIIIFFGITGEFDSAEEFYILSGAGIGFLN